MKKEKGEAYYKQEKIKYEWQRLVGDDNIYNIMSILKPDGWCNWKCRSLMPESYWAALESKSISSNFTSGLDLVYRPKSLRGIENNNGWNSIFSISDYPKIAGNYLFLVDGRNVEQWYEDGVRFAKSHTHWREIENIPQPLF